MTLDSLDPSHRPAAGLDGWSWLSEGDYFFFPKKKIKKRYICRYLVSTLLRTLTEEGIRT